MTSIRSLAAASLVFIAGSAAADLTSVPSGRYGLDKTHAYITFSYSHLGFSTPQLRFGDFDVKLDLDSEAPENSRLSVEVDAASVDSGVEDWDEELAGDEFFDADRYPAITFVADRIESTGDDAFDVTGDLTVRDVSKPVTIRATINKAANHPLRRVPTIGVSGVATIKRSEFGLTKALPIVGDDVTIRIEVELPQEQK